MEDRRFKAREIVIQLANKGITLIADESERLDSYPHSKMTEEDCRHLKLYKREILDYLDSLSWSDDWGVPVGQSLNTWCPAYGHPVAWKSIYGDHLICGTCYPPASEKIVAEWIQRE